MSRPFSYNDENFTVIGNMLFIHYHYNSNLFYGLEFLIIPPEIKKRLYHKENYLLMTNTNNASDNALVPVTIVPGAMGSFLTVREGVRIPEIETGERWYYGLYLLKDI